MDSHRGCHCPYLPSNSHGNGYKYDLVLHAAGCRTTDLLALPAGGFIGLLYQGRHAGVGTAGHL